MSKIFSLLIVAIILTFSQMSYAQKNEKYASLVMDADTGTIISQRHADSKRYPASLTKMMTLLMVFEALDRGDLKKNDRIYISKHAASMVPSKFYLKPGQYIKVEDAIYALVTKSANDVAVGIAEKIGGTESRFGNLMTSRARSIGMKSTVFKNASGLPNSRQVTTARDMATLARYILQRYPHYYRYFSTRNFNYNGKSYRNHNRLLDSYKGMDGFKTGYINASGFNLVASARQNNRRLIGVVFGGRSSATRNSHMAEILDQGFKKAKNIRMAVVKAPPIPKPKPISQNISVYATTPAPIPKKNTIAKVSQADTASNYASIGAMTNRAAQQQIIQPSPLTQAIQNNQFETVLSNQQVATAPRQSIERVAVNPLPEPTIPNEWNNQNRQNAAMAQLPHPKDTIGKWSIQIGAFESRVKTDDILRRAIQSLPAPLTQSVRPLTVPLQTTDGTLFRARLGGFDQAQALQACTYFKDCMTVAPRAVKFNAQ